MLDGHVVVVTGDGEGFAGRLAAALAGVGARPFVVGPGGDVPAHLEERASVRAALAAAGEQAGGRVAVVVHADVDVAGLEPAGLVATSEAEWDRRAEAPLRRSLACLQAAYEVLRDGGGRIVVVAPTAAMTGAAGMAPAAAAFEGLRSLAKGAARQWGSAGVTVNCVAPSLSVVGAEDPSALAPPALGRGAGIPDVAAAVAMVAGPAAAFVTGATVAVDGGVWMTP